MLEKPKETKNKLETPKKQLEKTNLFILVPRFPLTPRGCCCCSKFHFVNTLVPIELRNRGNRDPPSATTAATLP
jgi:hypothetical protein